jgi:uncharacterized protein (UPF0305 family)
MSLFGKKPKIPESAGSIDDISFQCRNLKNAKSLGELGGKISVIVLAYSPTDIQRMKQNFATTVLTLTPEYREELKKKINEHLLGTYQRIRLARQQGTFATLGEPVTVSQNTYWDMVERQCQEKVGNDAPRIRFLKYLLAGYCMLVLGEPGHPPGTPFPGGDQVEYTGGIYYCPVRDKANDVDSALCPYCPAQQTPEVGYLRPPTGKSEHRKQEFIDNCYRYHNFNG